MEEPSTNNNGIRQRSIKRTISYSGIGLHSGVHSTVVLQPAPPGSGIVFVRTDLPEMVKVPATLSNVNATSRGTSLISGSAEVGTVEHLMAALFGLGVGNVIVELDNIELPAADGSSLPFVQLLEEAGIEEQPQPRSEIHLSEPMWVSEDDCHIIALPDDRTRINFFIEFDHPLIRIQSKDYDIKKENFAREIAPARTFGFLKEVEVLRSRGLALGGSLDNSVVFDQDDLLNKEGLRFLDEPVRHKILDLIGDLSLLGAIPKAHIIAIKSSHSLNFKLATQISKTQ